ncbi:MAG: 4Fe-4S dicluster domain-containing protein [Candidatus Njordarchaeales archaeon]
MENEEKIWILRDPLLCTGCRLCEVACSITKENTIWPEASRIRILEFFPGVDVPFLCAQCDDYPCVDACPTNALSVDEKTGTVIVDESKCILCSACIEACPSHVPRILDEKKAVIICDLCGGQPACVEICQKAGYNALKIVSRSPSKRYKLYAKDPYEVAKMLSINLYGNEEVL